MDNCAGFMEERQRDRLGKEGEEGRVANRRTWADTLVRSRWIGREGGS